MTLPRVDRLRFMFLSSERWSSSISSFLLSFSLPAKSHRFSLLRTIRPFSTYSCFIWKMLCDLELCWFSMVHLVILLRSPSSIKLRASCLLSTTYSYKPSIWIPSSLSSLTCNCYWKSSDSKSKICSLYTWMKLTVIEARPKILSSTRGISPRSSLWNNYEIIRCVARPYSGACFASWFLLTTKGWASANRFLTVIFCLGPGLAFVGF